MKWRNISIDIIAGLLSALFIYTGVNKLLDYDDFVFQLGRSPYLQHLAKFIAIPLPVGELLIVIALIIPRTRLLGLYASFFLMFLFSGYVWIMLHKSYYLPCTCGGILQKMSWQQHFVFNVGFTVLSLAGILLQVNKVSRPVMEKLKIPVGA
jgi:uncharacterized membrane protein YphA (DoxX/SURF4 family)